MLSRCLDDADDFQSPMLKYIDPGKSFAHQAAWGCIFIWYMSLSVFREHTVHLFPGKSHTTARGHQDHRLRSIAY